MSNENNWEIGRKYVTRDEDILTLIADTRAFGIDHQKPLLFLNNDGDIFQMYENGTMYSREDNDFDIVGKCVEPKWRPLRGDERFELRGVWLREKDSKSEFPVDGFIGHDENVIIGDLPVTLQMLFVFYEHLDKTPVGKLDQ